MKSETANGRRQTADGKRQTADGRWVWLNSDVFALYGDWEGWDLLVGIFN